MEEINSKLDFFICHASEDKEEIAIPIYEGLKRLKIKCWLDRYEIDFGDSIIEKIQEGINLSQFSLIIMSHNWFNKDWTRKELFGLLSREIRKNKTIVIPLIVDDERNILENIPFLEDKYYIKHQSINDTVRVLFEFIKRKKEFEPKDICFISSEYPPNIIGGLGVHVNELTNSLANNGLNVNIVLPQSNVNYLSSNDKLTLLPLTKVEATYDNPVSWLNFATLAVNKICSLATLPDVIHCHDWVTILPGIICKIKLQIPLIYHLHLPNKRPFCSSIENLGLVCSDLVTVNSEYIKEEVLSRNLSIKNIKVIKNGVNTKQFKPNDGKEEDYILYVGRLVHQKGIDTLIRAFWYVSKEFPNTKLKIVGIGELEDYLKRLCTNLMIKDKVSFEGLKRGEDLTSYYQNCKLVVVPSIYEPFGMTAIEALACKKPVIASNLMGLKENIINDKTGFLFEKDDYLGLAQWIMHLLFDDVKRHELGNNGYEYIINNGFDWDTISKEFISIYMDISKDKISKCDMEAVHKYIEQIKRLAEEQAEYLPKDREKLFDNLFNVFSL